VAVLSRSIRSTGSGSRSIEVVYHQNGRARSRRRGKDRVVNSRERVDGFSVAMDSVGVVERALPTSRRPDPDDDAVGVT
jgi:hypothetical protein